MKFITGSFLLLFSLFLWAASPSSDTDITLHLDWLDAKVNPSDSFYRYANGTWQKKNPIPPQYSAWGTFYILHEKVQKLIHQLLSNAANDKTIKYGSIEQKIGDFYFSGMDESKINALGIKPLEPELKQIQAIQNITDLQKELAHLHRIGVDAFFGFGSMQDFKNSEIMIGAAVQGGLGLPDRDYYVKNTPKFKKIREIYIKHMAKMFELLGDQPTQAATEANVVMRLETNMAKASMTQVEQRDPKAIYHMKSLIELKEITPNFSWPNYFEMVGSPKITQINLAMPKFFKNMNILLQRVSINDWKIYLRWHLIDTYAPYLSQAFVTENFRMNAFITGAKVLLPRWQRVVENENSLLGFAVGKMYVEKYFPPSSKQAVLEILHNIRLTLREDLKNLNWMSPATKKAALKKLDMMGERVGYPSKWLDYSSVVIDRHSYVVNVMHAHEFLTKHELDKIGKPVDKTEWAMTPQTVNAYYDPSMNNINLPAGILQSPFFDPAAPAAVNYGGIGFVVGHEMTHGFDDQGAQFDGHGNLKNWWTAKDLKKFHEATNCIVEQFSKYKVDSDLSVQGKLVVGEATADLGGLILAYHAFHSSNAYKIAKTIHGFTPDQQFFIAAAHIWATNIRLEQLRNLATVDPHPPASYRVDGTLANMPQFQFAFTSVADRHPERSEGSPDSREMSRKARHDGLFWENSPMVNKHRCVIW